MCASHQARTCRRAPKPPQGRLGTSHQRRYATPRHGDRQGAVLGDEQREAIAGALAAQGFILENLYALLLGGDADPVAACRATGDAMLRDFAALRENSEEALASAGIQRVLRYGQAELERFWAAVEDRLAPGAGG